MQVECWSNIANWWRLHGKQQRTVTLHCAMLDMQLTGTETDCLVPTKHRKYSQAGCCGRSCLTRLRCRDRKLSPVDHNLLPAKLQLSTCPLVSNSLFRPTSTAALHMPRCFMCGFWVPLTWTCWNLWIYAITKNPITKHSITPNVVGMG